MDNYRSIKKVLFVLLIANIAVTAAKILLGVITNSSALSADGFHSLADSANNVIGIIGITVASRPKDVEHPYGYKKVETMASLIISGALLFMAFNVISESIYKISHPDTIYISLENLLILASTIVINIFVATYERKKGQEYNSQFLVADSIHTKSDVFVSIGVIITLILIKLGVPPIIDVVISFVVAAFILKASYDIFKDCMSVLMDKKTLELEEVETVVKEFPVIKNVHKVRSRGFQDHIYLDMHILVNIDLNVEEVHDLVHEVERKLQEKTDKQIDLVIHVEPYYEDYPSRVPSRY